MFKLGIVIVAIRVAVFVALTEGIALVKESLLASYALIPMRN